MSPGAHHRINKPKAPSPLSRFVRPARRVWFRHLVDPSAVALPVAALPIGSPRVIPVGMALRYAADEFAAVAR